MRSWSAFESSIALLFRNMVAASAPTCRSTAFHIAVAYGVGPSHTLANIRPPYQYPDHLPQRLWPVREELNPLLTEHDVKRRIGHAHGKGTALDPRDSCRSGWDRLRACDLEHALVEIQPTM